MALDLNESIEVKLLHEEIERLQERLSERSQELSNEEERAEQAEERVEDLARELDAMSTPADLIRGWATRRTALGLCTDVEELARDVEEKVWEFRK